VRGRGVGEVTYPLLRAGGFRHGQDVDGVRALTAVAGSGLVHRKAVRNLARPCAQVRRAEGRPPGWAYFCSSVQIAVYSFCTSGGQVGAKWPFAWCSSGITTSGAPSMSSGMNSSEPSMPLA
jgi:hypothetical protein